MKIQVTSLTRFRIGLLVPSSNTTMEQEFRLMLPKDISIHVARMRLREVVRDELLNMEGETEEEAIKLADAKVDVIGYGCTSGSLVQGLNHDKRIVERIKKATDKPAVATAGAVVEALKSLRLSRISVATPYNEEINALERRFLKQSGFVIEKMRSIGLTDNLEIAKLSSAEVYNLIKKSDSPKSEGLFASCTNMPTIDVVAKLERALRKPVVSSNAATLWAMMRRLRYSLRTKRYGRLLFLG